MVHEVAWWAVTLWIMHKLCKVLRSGASQVTSTPAAALPFLYLNCCWLKPQFTFLTHTPDPSHGKDNMTLRHHLIGDKDLGTEIRQEEMHIWAQHHSTPWRAVEHQILVQPCELCLEYWFRCCTASAHWKPSREICSNTPKTKRAFMQTLYTDQGFAFLCRRYFGFINSFACEGEIN